MKAFALIYYPDPLLEHKATEVGEKDVAKKNTIILRMEHTMELNEGVGLAAPQVGISEQIIVIKDGDANYAFFNPKIVKRGRKKTTDEEGCLSLPGVFLKIKRPEEVEVEAFTPKGKKVRILAEGLTARIFQHEIDHLQGLLIIDRINPLARLRLKRQLRNLFHERNSAKSV